MQDATLWWLLAAGAVAAELATGTFYLLMLALGLAAGALAAHAGSPLALQLVAAAVVGGGAVAAWTALRARRATGAAHEGNPDMNLDIGATVLVAAWKPDGTATVHYRGADWTALPADPARLQTGAHRVREVVGSRLVLEPAGAAHE